MQRQVRETYFRRPRGSCSSGAPDRACCAPDRRSSWCRRLPREVRGTSRNCLWDIHRLRRPQRPHNTPREELLLTFLGRLWGAREKWLSPRVTERVYTCCINVQWFLAWGGRVVISSFGVDARGRISVSGTRDVAVWDVSGCVSV